MSTWRNNGGWNRSHGTVEKTPRIDSFEAGAVEGWGTLFGYADGGLPLVLDCCHSFEPDGEIVEVWLGGRSTILDLSRKENGFGGSQAFFLCPACGGRVRYLYQVGAAFLCRKCAQLNYRSQQETRSDSMHFYRKGMGFAEKHLVPCTLGDIDGFSFCRWLPERPRYMHQTTYRRYLIRFLRYQKKHSDRQMADMLKILGMFK